MKNVIFVPIEKIIVNQYQPEEFIDSAQVLEIAESLKHFRDNGQKGLLQVPLARRVNGVYEEAFGRHRLLAFQHLATEDPFWSEMPLFVKDLTDREMFELMGTENMKRRDVTVVEKARIFHDYMTKFEATSVQTAQTFGVTEEQVRGTVRLNNLPDEAKQKLAAGEITITTARTILSMQKVAPREVVVEAIDRIVKGANRFGRQETPDEVVEDIMSELEDVREMWSGSGKARGGRDGWLLDMKNFPNRFLPALTPVGAAIALGIQDDEEMMEKAATWIRSSLGELPDLDSESLRVPDHLLELLEHLINPPACSACPFHTVVQETHYCGMETCFDRKTRAWIYERMRTASKDLKIEIYDAEVDGEFRVLEDNYNSEGEHYKIFKKRSKDLRIALAMDIDRKKPQSGYTGVPSDAVVMVVGKTLKESLENGQKERAEKRSKEQAANLLQSLRTVKRELIEWEVAGHLKTIFDGLNMEALKTLWDTPRYSSAWNVGRQSLPEGVRQPSSDETISVKEDFFRQLFAINMVRKIGGYWRNKTTSEYTAQLGETVKGWGVKLPKSVSRLASRMDEEIAAVTAETE